MARSGKPDLNLFACVARLEAMQEDSGVRNAREYYNSPSAEGLYSIFWGGEGLPVEQEGALVWGIFRFQIGEAK